MSTTRETFVTGNSPRRSARRCPADKSAEGKKRRQVAAVQSAEARSLMTFRTLTRRSLRYHWRAHLGVVLGAAIGSAALIGALVVGDSVKQSLRERVQSRLGEVGFALEGRDRFVTDHLADHM